MAREGHDESTGAPPGAAAVPGPAEREFVRFAHRYAHRNRAVVVISCALLAVPAMPPEKMPATAAVAGAVLVWSVVYYRLGVFGRRPQLVLAVDVVVLTGLCLSQQLTVPNSQTIHGSTWVLVAISIVAVAHQMIHPAPLAAALVVQLFALDLLGAVLDRADGWTYVLPNASWLLVQAALAQGLYRLVLRRSRAADTAAAQTAAVRRRHQVEQAQRTAEREYLATLHDTACATLLMVSAQGQSIRPEVVRVQAAKDLRRLAAEPVLTGEADLARELLAELADQPLRVRTAFDGPLGSVWHPAAAALRGSMGEALRNVARHAGVDTATVRAGRRGDRVIVTVADSGTGFDVSGVPDHRYGLARSVVDRMAAVGGRATVDSRPGHGTEVRLEWPHV